MLESRANSAKLKLSTDPFLNKIRISRAQCQLRYPAIGISHPAREDEQIRYLRNRLSK